MDKTCCFTGYRVEKFPFPLKNGVPEFNDLENKIYDAVFSLVDDGFTTFYCGMATGFDLLCGKAVIDLKRYMPQREIKLIAAVPFREQSSSFSEMWKKLYDIVLNESDGMICFNEKFTKGCFNERNRYMVDHSSTVVCYFDGQTGGTANTLKYASSKGRVIKNLAEYDLCDLYNEYSAYQFEI